MISAGIWEIGTARLCVRCSSEMATDYVMRCRWQMKKAPCERCGKESPTMVWQYTLNRQALEKIGRESG